MSTGASTGARAVMLVTPNLDIGGAQETILNLARYLPRLGRPSIVCTFEDGPLRAELERSDIPVEILSSRRHSIVALPFFAIEILGLRRILARLAAQHDVGVIYTSGLGTLDFLVATLRTHRRLQVWWTIQNVRFMVRPEHLPKHPWLLRPKRSAHRMLYRWGSRVVNGVIAVSDETAESFLREVGGVDDRVTIVYNAVDTDRFPAVRHATYIRRELGIDRDAHVMTMVGTFKRQKSHEHLITAVGKVAPHFPELRILLVGDGELREDCERQVRNMGLENEILFLGTRRDVPELLAASDSFVLSSLWEGLPLALIEAMASELPVVATAVSGSRFAVVDGITGRLVAPGDPDELANAIEGLLADPERAAAMGREGRARAEQLFSAQAQASQLISLFEMGPKL